MNPVYKPIFDKIDALALKELNELDKSVVKKMELVLDRYLKRYDWFEKIELETVGYSPSERVSHFAPVGTIYVDGDWLYEKWREYYHEGPFPDL